MTGDAPRTFIEKDATEWERDGWTSCPNSILRDPVLPWELRAVWAWLASHTATFEMTAEKLRQAGPKGRDWAYNALKELERHGLLTRHHEITETGQVVIRYRLHHRAVPEAERIARWSADLEATIRKRSDASAYVDTLIETAKIAKASERYSKARCYEGGGTLQECQGGMIVITTGSVLVTAKLRLDELKRK